MLLKVYKENQPVVLFLLPMAALFFWLPGFVRTDAACFSVPDATPLYTLLSNLICGSRTASLLVSVLLVLGGAILLNYVCSAHELLVRPSNLPALFFITYCSFHKSLLAFHPLLPASIFMILALHRLFETYRRDTAYSQAFDAGLFTAVASLFFPPSMLFIPLVYISFIIFRPFIWREWVIFPVGFILPFLFVFTGYFIFSDVSQAFAFFRGIDVGERSFSLDITIPEYIVFFLLFLINFFAFQMLVPGLAKSKVKTRKTYNFMVWVTVVIGLIFFVYPRFSVLYFSLFAIPLSMLSASFVLLQKKNWISEALYYLLLLFVVYGYVPWDRVLSP